MCNAVGKGYVCIEIGGVRKAFVELHSDAK